MVLYSFRLSSHNDNTMGMVHYDDDVHDFFYIASIAKLVERIPHYSKHHKDSSTNNT